MHHLTSTVGIVALAAAAVALVALLIAATMAYRIGRLRAEQKAVLGDRREDLVSHAAALQSEFLALQGYVHDTTERLDGRMHTAEGRLDGAISYTSLVRYDAYGEMSGRQSMSIALLDSLPERHRPVGDPPSRSGPPLRQAGQRRALRARALARGGRGGLPRAGRRSPRGPLSAPPTMRIGYFGPEGTYTQEAMLASAATLGLDVAGGAAADDLRHGARGS